MADIPEELQLQIGEEKTLRLPGLATAGYRWQAAVEDERVVTVSSRFEDSADKREANATSSRDELVTLAGRAQGATRLTLVQRRSWEKDAEPVAKYDIKVEVVAAAKQPTSEGSKK